MRNEWWKNAVVYQIYPKSFKDSNGDGIGDIKGIIEKLDYLQTLGINVIWICPTYKSPMDDNGYDISDYYQMDPIFGANEDLDELIKKAKEKNIKIILDLVVNHTSDEHAWFQEALKDKDSKYREYYIFKEGKNGNPPNNWRSIFGGSAWEQVGEEDVYYLHLFGKKQPDLNWENEVLRSEIHKMIEYWLKKGIAGFRLDAINYIKKDIITHNVEPDDIDGLCFPGPWVTNKLGIEEYLKEIRDQYFRKYNCMTVAEANVPYNLLDQFIGEDGVFDMIFDFTYTDLDVPKTGEIYRPVTWSIAQFREKIFVSQEETQKIGWGALYLENHDQPRSPDKYIPKEDINFYSNSMLAGLFMMLRGTPFIYQGQEIGMRNCPMDSIEEYKDLSAHISYKRALEAGLTKEEAMQALYRRSRDNSRTPFQWDTSKNAGFSNADQTWLKVNPNYQTINAKAQLEDDSSLFYFYKKLIQLRQVGAYADVLSLGEFHRGKEEDESIIAFERSYQGKRVLAICNFQNKIIKKTVKSSFQEVLCSNYGREEIPSISLELQPYEFVLLTIEKDREQ